MSGINVFFEVGSGYKSQLVDEDLARKFLSKELKPPNENHATIWSNEIQQYLFVSEKCALEAIQATAERRLQEQKALEEAQEVANKPKLTALEKELRVKKEKEAQDMANYQQALENFAAALKNPCNLHHERIIEAGDAFENKVLRLKIIKPQLPLSLFVQAIDNTTKLLKDKWTVDFYLQQMSTLKFGDISPENSILDVVILLSLWASIIVAAVLLAPIIGGTGVLVGIIAGHFLVLGVGLFMIMSSEALSKETTNLARAVEKYSEPRFFSSQLGTNECNNESSAQLTQDKSRSALC